jgi:spore coat polysaccharide biosynthesis protein SpsF (cytidylyltransferase family)
MRIIAIIQARLGSTRLPGKVLFDLEGRTMLEHIIRRVKASKLVNDVIVATTINKDDLEVVKMCANHGISVYCGSEDDVLDRYYQAARLFKTDHIVRITADDPFKDPEIIDKIIQVMIEDSFDYVSNTIKPTYPEGLDIEVFRITALEKAWKEAIKTSEREHVTPYIWKHPELFNLKNVENDMDLSSMRWTLDTQRDYEFTKAIYKRLYVPGKIFLMKDVLKLLNEVPELKEINAGIPRLSGYKQSVEED